MSSDCSIVDDYSQYILKKGTILYSGHCMPVQMLANRFWRQHLVGKSVLDRQQMKTTREWKELKTKLKGIDKFIIFCSTQLHVAESYA